MRIISGKLKGRRLTAPANLPVRPTTDFAKEALFNLIGNEYEFDSLSVIDLFSGTGNISYEFASRAAADIRSIDREYCCTNYISKTAKELKLDAISVIRSDVFKYLSTCPIAADIIFADPPYAMPQEQISRIPILVFERNLLTEGGLLIVEHSQFTDLSDDPHYSHTRTYGNVNFSFFRQE